MALIGLYAKTKEIIDALVDGLDVTVSSRLPGTVTHQNRLDASISSRMANPASFVTNAPTTASDYSNTHLNITGSGYLVCIWHGTSSETTYAIQIDGGVRRVLGTADGTYGSGGPPFGLLRFNQSLKVTATSSGAALTNVWAVLD